MPGNRATFLEDRLSSQERATALLLDQAFRIKDDIVSYLHGSKNYQQGEATARQLLENHIQTITSIVKKLSHDIEVGLGVAETCYISSSLLCHYQSIN